MAGMPVSLFRWPVRLGAFFLTLLLLAVTPSGAWAQPILHEPVAVPRLRCHDGVCRQDGTRPDTMPEAVIGQDGLIHAPSFANAAQTQVFASGATTANMAHSPGPKPGTDPPPLRRTRLFPDTSTGPETGGDRLFHEVFSPAIFPYKRMTVLDGVDHEGALILWSAALSPLETTANHGHPDRDPFYGGVVVDFLAGNPVPIPTPAAGFRLLSYRSSPARQLQFFVDGAENLYVTSSQGGRHRLTFLLDAPAAYFAGPVPDGKKFLVRDIPKTLLFPLPRALRKEARQVLDTIGISDARDTDYETILNLLVGYFRGFSVGDLPNNTAGSLYLRLALNKKGACRHRAYAFVITALQAGIPARYVENELHAFVEVWVPSMQGKAGYFRRINLGGAPLRQRVLDAEERVAYQERGGDPFPKPPEFQQGFPESIVGGPQKPKRGATTTATARGRDGQTSPNRTASTQETAPSGKTAEPTKTKAVVPENPKQHSPPDRLGMGNGTETVPSPALQAVGRPAAENEGRFEASLGEDDVSMFEDRRPENQALRPTSVSVSAVRRVYRGATVSVSGKVYVENGDAEGIEVLLGLTLPTGTRFWGKAVSQKDGRFVAEVELPKELPLGDYNFVARVKGDKERRGSANTRY